MVNKILYIIVSILVLQLSAMVYLLIVSASDHKKIADLTDMFSWTVIQTEFIPDDR